MFTPSFLNFRDGSGASRTSFWSVKDLIIRTNVSPSLSSISLPSRIVQVKCPGVGAADWYFLSSQWPFGRKVTIFVSTQEPMIFLDKKSSDVFALAGAKALVAAML